MTTTFFSLVMGLVSALFLVLKIAVWVAALVYVRPPARLWAGVGAGLMVLAHLLGWLLPYLGSVSLGSLGGNGLYLTLTAAGLSVSGVLEVVGLALLVYGAVLLTRRGGQLRS